MVYYKKDQQLGGCNRGDDLTQVITPEVLHCHAYDSHGCGDNELLQGIEKLSARSIQKDVCCERAKPGNGKKKGDDYRNAEGTHDQVSFSLMGQPYYVDLIARRILDLQERTP